MRTEVPDLLPLLRSRLQGDLLAQLYLHPNKEYSLTALARALGSNVKTLHAETNRLVRSGFARDRRLGQMRLVSAPLPSPVTAALSQLLVLSYGPLALARELAPRVPGVTQAFIYGSWAARYEGEHGPIPNDVDIALVGDIRADAADDLASLIQAQISKPVDVRRIPPDLWTDPATSSPFVLALRQSPKIDLLEEVQSGPAVG